MPQTKRHSRRILAACCAALFLAACAAETKSNPSSRDESSSSRISRYSQEIQSGSAVSNWAGSMLPGCLDGDVSNAQFIKPYGLCIGPNGGILLIDHYGNQLRLIKDGMVTTLAGAADALSYSGYPMGGYLNGDAAQALLNRPRFAQTSAEGAVIFSDSANNMIRVYDKGHVYILAGAAESGFQDGNIKDARFNLPSGIAIGRDGTVFVADTLNHCIRTISAAGEVKTLAGTPGISGYQDGTAAQAQFCEPNDIDFAPDGSLYIVDKGNQRIRRIYNGVVSTVAGSGSETDQTTGYVIGGYKDGPGSSAQFMYPTGICFDGDGTAYIADTGNNCIRTITKSYTVTTIAGNRMPGNRGGSAKDARFNQPLDVLYDDGKLYVTDSYNHVVKMVALDQTENRKDDVL